MALKISRSTARSISKIAEKAMPEIEKILTGGEVPKDVVSAFREGAGAHTEDTIAQIKNIFLEVTAKDIRAAGRKEGDRMMSNILDEVFRASPGTLSMKARQLVAGGAQPSEVQEALSKRLYQVIGENKTAIMGDGVNGDEVNCDVKLQRVQKEVEGDKIKSLDTKPNQDLAREVTAHIMREYEKVHMNELKKLEIATGYKYDAAETSLDAALAIGKKYRTNLNKIINSDQTITTKSDLNKALATDTPKRTAARIFQAVQHDYRGLALESEGSLKTMYNALEMVDQAATKGALIHSDLEGITRRIVKESGVSQEAIAKYVNTFNPGSAGMLEGKYVVDVSAAKDAGLETTSPELLSKLMFRVSDRYKLTNAVETTDINKYREVQLSADSPVQDQRRAFEDLPAPGQRVYRSINKDAEIAFLNIANEVNREMASTGAPNTLDSGNYNTIRDIKNSDVMQVALQRVEEMGGLGYAPVSDIAQEMRSEINMIHRRVMSRSAAVIRGELQLGGKEDNPISKMLATLIARNKSVTNPQNTLKRRAAPAPGDTGLSSTTKLLGRGLLHGGDLVLKANIPAALGSLKLSASNSLQGLVTASFAVLTRRGPYALASTIWATPRSFLRGAKMLSPSTWGTAKAGIDFVESARRASGLSGNEWSVMFENEQLLNKLFSPTPAVIAARDRYFAHDAVSVKYGHAIRNMSSLYDQDIKDVNVAIDSPIKLATSPDSDAVDKLLGLADWTATNIGTLSSLAYGPSDVAAREFGFQVFGNMANNSMKSAIKTYITARRQPNQTGEYLIDIKLDFIATLVKELRLTVMDPIQKEKMIESAMNVLSSRGRVDVFHAVNFVEDYASIMIDRSFFTYSAHNRPSFITAAKEVGAGGLTTFKSWTPYAMENMNQITQGFAHISHKLLGTRIKGAVSNTKSIKNRISSLKEELGKEDYERLSNLAAGMDYVPFTRVLRNYGKKNIPSNADYDVLRYNGYGKLVMPFLLGMAAGAYASYESASYISSTWLHNTTEYQNAGAGRKKQLDGNAITWALTRALPMASWGMGVFQLITGLDKASLSSYSLALIIGKPVKKAMKKAALLTEEQKADLLPILGVGVGAIKDTVLYDSPFSDRVKGGYELFKLGTRSGEGINEYLKITGDQNWLRDTLERMKNDGPTDTEKKINSRILKRNRKRAK